MKRKIRRLLQVGTVAVTALSVYWFAVATAPLLVHILTPKAHLPIQKVWQDTGFLPPPMDTVKPVQMPEPEVAVPVPPTVTVLPTDPVEEIRPVNAGEVHTNTYLPTPSAACLDLGGGYLRNATKLSAERILEAASKPPAFSILADGTPEVLIMHTHTTESYRGYQGLFYDKDVLFRTTDAEKNMIAVGNAIEAALTAAGIGVIHDTTMHDYPSYTGAYGRSADTVSRILEKYPSIRVVLDVHRDAIQVDDDTIIAPVATINGKQAAQVMIISGCDDGTMGMPNYLENLKFSAALQRQMGQDYPTLARPILFDYRKYNQHLTTGSILLEMGGHGNTLEEAVYCGELVGDSLASVLLSLRA